MDNTLSIRPGDLEDINSIGFLAQQIWPITYGDILSAEQLRYMLNLFYSPASLRKQMVEDHHQFAIVEQEEEPIGFASWSATDKLGVYKLHKLYVLTGQQGKGLGRTLLQYVFETIGSKGAKTLQLNVNRHNKARQFYERMGFAVVKEEDVPIGNNYFMNDYVMEAAVPQ
ncbi:MAG: GNAT family N-acetyltransferase [Bacteroidetes bacterium]|nr:GNAT family N-acetyltransferase [Bacteroidota bacterium]